MLCPCRELEKLQAAAKQLLDGWTAKLRYECTDGTVSPKLVSGAGVAENRAVNTQAKWGAHKREGRSLLGHLQGDSAALVPLLANDALLNIGNITA